MRRIALCAGLAALSGCAARTVQTESVEYMHGGVVLDGFLAHDASPQGRRPGVLIVHAWDGQGPYVRSRARQLAELGYVAFAIDMYGKGVRGGDSAASMQLSAPFRKDRRLMRDSALAGLAVLRARPDVDPDRIAAIGYCFGGTTVIELARDGAPVAGIVSFHGGLDTPAPGGAEKFKGRILVLTGADDPHVPPAQVEAFKAEMAKAGADCQLISYPDAVHSFTDPAAGPDKSKGAAYNKAADLASWAEMRRFFRKIF
jgi:dienelactone hydrolase